MMSSDIINIEEDNRKLSYEKIRSRTKENEVYILDKVNLYIEDSRKPCSITDFDSSESIIHDSDSESHDSNVS